MFAIRAVAAGVSQAHPFFEEDGALGKDTTGTQRARPIGGVQASNSPGLYGGAPGGHQDSGGQGGNGGTPRPDGSGGPAPDFGGSARPGTCAVGKLKKFLTAPKNSAKAREWARVLNIGPAEIPGYVDRLTPVVLRHDTLVTNHEYKHGKAVPFDALLQTGIAILVDRQGLPAVKCSCGNPLRPSEANIEKASVQFKGGNRKWSGYRPDGIVVVEPPPGKARIDRLRLVDVENPDRGITRPLGTAGADDTPFDPHAQKTVPQVTGLTFAEASARLANAGLALAYDGGSLPRDDVRVTSSRPVEGSTLEWGEPVTLFVVSDTDHVEAPDTPKDTGGPTSSPDGSSTGPGETTTGATTGATAGESGTGATNTGATAGETSAGETSAGGTTTGATAGETSTGATNTGATAGETSTGAASTGATSAGETSAGAGATGGTGAGTGATGATTAGETDAGTTTAGRTDAGATTTGQTATGQTTTGPVGPTTPGTGDTGAGESGSVDSGGADSGGADSGGVGDSVGPSSPDGGAT
ncbi:MULTISPECIES: PASTA domain-containing protein [unclassified Streptomyces]|uniref:PASTA domain-containing protein n=1 Tax=unclassified Streptomyces TaxID=2593676 RepID=UPI00224CBA1B|nr:MULTISPECIES: PASTA domain-containing protein [unclassified Streptomyces]MCX4992556.1 PASTA domain-containing protein [Streptomyces sp. NBC_00568]MCX5002206.1 PASTA domain-containing protein [Streptomyces sp. NBC_00638]